MKWLVLIVVMVWAEGAAAASAPCAPAEDYFRTMNVSADDADGTGAVCGGQCCGRRRETELRALVRRRMVARAVSATRPLAAQLHSTRTTLEKHLMALSQQSQNKTSLLFEKLYRGHSTRARTPISVFYEDIRTLLRPISTGTASDELGSPAPRDLADSANTFFRNVFPVAYHNVLKLGEKQFTPEYETCLKDVYKNVQPFGEIPEQLGKSLSATLKGTRSLLQALALGAEVLSASEEVLNSADSDTCSTIMLRAAACARCRGFAAKPCRNYCLNVVRGCLGSLVAELDAPWSGYVEGVERLTRSDADADDALRDLDNRVSKAIMYALENHDTLEKKVRQDCGPPTTAGAPTGRSEHTFSAPARRDDAGARGRAPPLDMEWLEIAVSLAESKRLFAGLSDRICDDPELTNKDSDKCWNGESIGEYIKPLTSLSDQRYNPEVTGGAPPNSRISALADRLRHARQLLAPTRSIPSAEAFMQGDDAGEGSGSGRSYSDDDAEYDAEGSGDGSGDGRIVGGIYTGQETPNSVTPKTGASTVMSPTLGVVMVSTAALVSRSFT